jgi:hypothetical protein
MADFAAQIRAFRDKTLKNVDSIVQEATVNVTAALVDATPIDKTALRANWRFAVGEANDEADYLAEDHSPGGSDTVRVLAEEIRAVPAGGVTRVSNSLAYMPLIEFGLYTNHSGGKRTSGRTINGFSTQAPAGVIGVTALQWPDFVKTAIAKVIT